MTDQPKRRNWLRVLNVIFLVVGAGALALMIRHVGWDRLSTAVAQIGWAFALICLLHFVDVALDSHILRACAGDDGARTPYYVFLRASLAGHAINEAVPFNSIGELTKFNLMREYIPGQCAAASLIVQNMIRFVTTAVVIALAAPTAILVLDPTSLATVLLIVTSSAFAVAGALCLWLLFRGIGELPLILARRVGFSVTRVDSWRSTWTEVAEHWRTVAANKPRMRGAWLASIGARMSSIAESALILYCLGIDNLLAMSLLTMANYQVVVWATSFIPFQAGTTEGGAYFLYQSVGVAAHFGVLVELIRRARRLVFIGMGLLLLGYKAATPPRLR